MGKLAHISWTVSMCFQLGHTSKVLELAKQSSEQRSSQQRRTKQYAGLTSATELGSSSATIPTLASSPSLALTTDVPLIMEICVVEVRLKLLDAHSPIALIRIQTPTRREAISTQGRPMAMASAMWSLKISKSPRTLSRT